MIKDRNAALARLSEALSSVATHGGQAVFVQGEAGIGKTTLIQTFLDRLPDDQIRAAALCDPLNTPRPLGPVRDLARMLVKGTGITRDDAHVFEGLVHHLQSAATPIVLVIEDLHWADQRSLDWLKFVGRRLSQLPVLLLGSFRADEVDQTHPLRTALSDWPGGRRHDIPLDPLSVAAVRDLVQGHMLSGDQVHQITGGNPFFVTEILNAGGDVQALPLSVADAVNARLNTLSPAEQRFVETVACCPMRIPYETLRGMDLGNVAAMCDAAVARHILVPEGADFRFRHELARRAAYARMPPAAKREAHEVFLSALLADPDAEGQIDLIVHHAQGAHRTDLVLTYGPKAAEAAAQLGAHREAAQYLAAVMDRLDGQGPRFAAEICESWAYEAGLALVIDEEVIAARERALALWRDMGDTERVGENLRWLSRLHWYRGESEIAQRYVHEAIDVLEGQGASPARAKAYGLRAQFHMLQDQMEEALEWGQRAYDIALEVDEHEMVAHALNTMGSARMFRGDASGEALLRESLKISKEHGFHEQAARVYTNLSECLVESRDLDGAADLLDEGIAFDTAHDLDSWTYYLVGRKAHLSFELDRLTEALAVTEDVLTRDNQTLLMRMPAMIIRARAKLRLGHADAGSAMKEAAAAAEKIDEPQYLVTIRIAQIEAAVLDGHDARDAVAAIAALAPDQLSPRKRGEFLYWAKIACVAVDWPVDDALPPAFSAALAGDFASAAQAFEAEQSAYLAAWAHVMNDATAAADAQFEQIGASAARKALRRRGAAALPALARGPYRAASQHPYGLTRAEQAVLTMIADGKSNAVIAQEQSRSPRTVENHVSSILSKLRCKNRLEVVLRVQGEGWILASGTQPPTQPGKSISEI